MKLVIWLAVPIGLLLLAATVTVIVEMASGSGYCHTWLAFLSPDCDGGPSGRPPHKMPLRTDAGFAGPGCDFEQVCVDSKRWPSPHMAERSWPPVIARSAATRQSPA